MGGALYSCLTKFDSEVNFPDFEGADNGKAAGINVALLKDIAEYNGINIEPVIMESASEFTALASGKVEHQIIIFVRNL